MKYYINKRLILENDGTPYKNEFITNMELDRKSK